MRLLLIAHDFPPIPSPQAIRWAYLTRELALAGHEVHVLAPDVAARGDAGLPTLPDGVIVHRVHPGPVSALGNRWKRSLPPGQSAAAEAAFHDPDSVQLNWKGRIRQRVEDRVNRTFRHGLDWPANLLEAARTIQSWFLFPDARSEWLPSALKRLATLLDTVAPAVVITSHEPANTIELGLQAKQEGFAWVADLGDPVLAPYTPRRWRRRAHALERALCQQADLVAVTSARTRDLLAERHGLDPARAIVLTQGYDAHDDAAGVAAAPMDPARLELLYTGSLYAFRRSDELLSAVIATPGVRLNIASAMLPPRVIDAARAHPTKLRLLGFVPHRQALALQRRCDLLVNIANDDPAQVPGKLYEYIGTDTPVLQVGGDEGDVGAALVRNAGLGWCEPANAAAIAARLQALRDAKAALGQVQRPGGTAYDVGQHAWDRLAATLVRALLPLEQDTAAPVVVDEMQRIAVRGPE